MSANDGMPPRDHAPEEERPDDGAHHGLEENLKSKSTWRRLLFMIIFMIIWGISRFVVGAVVVLQFLWVLFAGETNSRLTEFGQSLATYTYQIVLYLTFNTEQRPWPFADWPGGPPPE
jgi:hypothetical protein